MKIYLEITDTDSTLGVVEARINEAINHVTFIRLDLISPDELKAEQMEGIVGKKASLHIEDVIDNNLHHARWDGRIFEIVDVGSRSGIDRHFSYRAILRPELWRLNYSTHARSFVDITRPELIDELLKEHRLEKDVHYTTDYAEEDKYPKFNQLLQSGGTDLAFFKSLMAHAGIVFYFDGKDDGSDELLRIIDDNVYYRKYESSVLIQQTRGITTSERHVDQICRIARMIPATVSVTSLLGDGSTRSRESIETQDGAGAEGDVYVYVPEGGEDMDGNAQHVSRVISQGFGERRLIYQGNSNHLGVRPGRRLEFLDNYTAAEFKLLVSEVQHTFRQDSLAALSEEGSGDVDYRNHFKALHVNSHVRPMASLEIEIDMGIDDQPAPGAVGDPGGLRGQHPSSDGAPLVDYQTDNAKLNHDMRELSDSTHLLHRQVQRLKRKVEVLQDKLAAAGSGLVSAEIVEDGWVTEGNELVCKVKADEFKEPIVVKASISWQDEGAGTLYLPRVGNYVWIQRVNQTSGNDWVIVGYRPTSKVVATHNPANSFSIDELEPDEDMTWEG